MVWKSIPFASNRNRAGQPLEIDWDDEDTDVRPLFSKLTNEQELESSCLRSVVSPDGRIATQRDLVRDGPSAGIYLLHEQGPREEMFEELTLDGPPLIFRSGYRWFPNRDRMIFSAREEGDSFDSLYILDIETKSYRKLTSGDWNDGGPDVSPPLPDTWLQRE